MKLEPGYYWVKFAGTWQPGELKHGNLHSWWLIIDSDNLYSDEELDEIGERLIHT